MTGNVFVSEIDAVTYVVQSMAEGRVPCGELVGVT